ncbi:hypothetical protein CLV46_0992 [Diaminobutyricimonas aerilata]|uniref:Uncharacterized protein n=1 Tax=Diaminobutyricimonas aerilata TaxID=1162967 RepID=A0A2M9CHP8_9MICO|nr:hypothetical protein [Diaminobutyricimonas aerilata]PJJ71444.1 hypothetical protein CLV46_0992 [Diaminobutyricimonas aerilata]
MGDSPVPPRRMAADALTADLEPRHEHALKRWGRALLGAALGDGVDEGFDLVVRRRDTGAVIMRTPADVGSPDFLLAQVEEDMRTKTLPEFLAEWRLPEDLPGLSA